MSRAVRMAACHPDLKHYAKDMCLSCYKRARWAAEPEFRDAKRASYHRNKHKHVDRRRQYYRDNRERIAANAAAWNKKHREKHRSYVLKREYGITADEYRDHLVGQAGRCLICGLVPKRDLVVDHDHVTGRVRGLLCSSCNFALGHLHDDADRAFAAAAYLRRAA